jgi:SagB-type dehydrogenase family enzyme
VLLKRKDNDMAVLKQSGYRTASASLSNQPVPPELHNMRLRFPQELVLVPGKEELVIDGAHRLIVLRGRSARTLVPQLVRLLDGTRTLAQLEGALPGIPPEHVRSAAAMLFENGLIEDGAGDASLMDESHPETLAFLRRNVGAARSSQSAHQAYEKLQQSHVLLVTAHSQSHSEMLKAVLESSGIGRITLLDSGALDGPPPAVESASGSELIVSLSFGNEDQLWYSKLDDWCHQHGFSWLRVVVDEKQKSADLGPLFAPDQGLCYRCLAAVHCPPETSSPGVPQEVSHDTAAFWTGMASLEIMYLLSGVGPLATGRDFQRYNLESWDVRKLRGVRLPGCPRCRPGHDASSAAGAIRPLDTALVFEDYVGMQSLAFSGGPELRPPGEHSTPLIFESKRLQNCEHLVLSREVPKLDLGALDVLSTPARNSEGRMNADELGSILMISAGLREARPGMRQIKRWNATGGNLGSVELFAVVCNVEGIPPGYYFYQPRDHSLAAFVRRAGALPVDEFIRRVVGIPEGGALPDALLIFTGAYHRLSRKYGVFGYRLVNLDAGVALAQMHLAARSLEIQSRTVARWPDDLVTDQLNLESWQEHCTAVAELSRASLPVPSPVLPGLQAVPEQAARPVAPGEFRGMTQYEVAQRLYQESRLSEGSLAPPAIPVVAPSPALGMGLSVPPGSISLPQPARGGRLVSDILSRRNSIRKYGPEPVSLEQLSTILHCAHQEDAREWADEHLCGLPLTFVVAATNVAGLHPAVYQYQNDDQKLLPLTAGLTTDDVVEMAAQPEFSEAPVFLWIFGDLAGACARHGAFGHRQLLLRAGAAGHRLWMSSLAMGLAGCLVAGVVPGAARRQFGFDGYRKASLLALAVGYGSQSAR